MARLLGPAGRGEVAEIAFLGQFIGLAVVVNYSDAIVLRNKKSETTEGLANAAISAGIVNALIGIAFGAIYIFLIRPDEFSRDEAFLFIFFLSSQVFQLVAYRVTEGTLRAKQRFDHINVLRLSMPLSYLLILCALFCFDISPRSAVIAHGCSCLFSAIACLALLRPKLGEFRGILHITKHASRYWVWATVSLTSLQVDKLFVINSMNEANIGFYFVAFTAAAPAQQFLMQAARTNSLPQVIAKEQDEQAEYVMKICSSVMSTSLAASAISLVAAPIIVFAFFGGAFEASARIAALLSVCTILLPVKSVLVEYLKIQERVGPVAIVEVSQILSFLVCAFLFPLTLTYVCLALLVGLSIATGIALQCSGLSSKRALLRIFSPDFSELVAAIKSRLTALRKET